VDRGATGAAEGLAAASTFRRVVVISPYRDEWPATYEAFRRRIAAVLGDRAVRIDHIGSTAVPDLDAKNVIDVQVTVRSLADADALADAGYRAFPAGRDHVPPGAPDDAREWAKRLFNEPKGERRANIHVREAGRANQRYALLFRDYLRAHPDAAEAYARLKRALAQELADPQTYTDVKDPACDLISIAAEEWAVATGWSAP
jgi:GrpB-like predicted nucleotidyltransferase (UPF0157 family)